MAASKNHKKAKPTAADRRAAAIIKKRLYAMGDKRPTQDDLVDKWNANGSERANQSLMSQYINGTIKHNLRSVMFFANVLKCDPRELYPGLPGLEHVAPRGKDEVRDAPIARPEFEPNEAAILNQLLELPAQMRNALIAVISNAYEMHQELEETKEPA